MHTLAATFNVLCGALAGAADVWDYGMQTALVLADSVPDSSFSLISQAEDWGMMGTALYNW